MKDNLPKGWTEDKTEAVVDHYESQSEDEAIAEDEAALAVEDTLIQVPVKLVAEVRTLIAKQANQ